MVSLATIADEPRLMTDEHGDEWLVIDNVPILDEHVDEEGTRYDSRLLQAIAANNNQRIADTGDECPIVMHHTPVDGDPRKDPEVVGYADKFRVQRFGKTRPRAAIYCRFKIYPSKREKVRYRNRRSVEIWPETSPEKRYIDPIALLGSETPRRDLGIIRYSNRARFRYHKGGEYCYRYEMGGAGVPTSPGSTNTYVAGEKKIRNQLSDPFPLAGNPEVMSQLAEGLKPLIEQLIEERLSETAGGDLTPVDTPDDGGDSMATDAMDMNDIMDPNAGMDDGLGGDLGAPADDMGGYPGMDAPPADPGMGGDMPPAAPDAMSDEDRQYAKQLYQRKCYSKGEDFDGAKAAFEGLGDDDRDLVSRYMKDCDDEGMASHYAKCCGADQDMKEGEPERYSKRYQKLQDENSKLRIEYRKSQQQVQQLQKRIADSQNENRRLRYQKRLSDKQMEGFIFDADEELDRVCSMNDDRAEDYIENVIPRFDKAPLGDMAIERVVEGPKQYSKLAQEEEARKQNRSKADAAGDLVLRYRKQRKELDFVKVYNYMVENNTDEYPEELIEN